MQVRNLGILVVCQLISTSGSIVVVMLGGIIGSTLATNKAFATLPLSMMVVAVASMTIPATMLMKRIGRRKGCALASSSAVVALLLAVAALKYSSFPVYILAVMLFGINMAFTQQYRYFAAESVAARYVPRAISLVLVGSIGAAFVGKELAIRGQFWIADIEFAGTFVVLAAMFAVQALLFFAMLPAHSHDDSHLQASDRGLAEIVRQPVFLVAVLGATCGYGLMTLVMTATPLSMHVNDGYSVEQVGRVIQIHVLGMYVPSLVTGFLIEKIGVIRLMFVGAFVLLMTSVIGLQGHTVLHYWWALLMLGVGWNFLFVGGTTMLTYTYSMAERFRAQAVNEFLVFGTSATASLLAGTVMYFFGWHTLMLIPIPILLIICVALVIVRKNALLISKSKSNA
ncbi:MAG: MFS transporter [Gammaproteobacteria bacterium]|nr:MFS transporter [Gammaproteobacteria bacterium]MDH5262646.1 MFS transporter [Gammaproteobacteria bacterium]